MPTSSSLPPLICYIDISSTRQVGENVPQTKYFSADLSPGIVPSSCTCIVDTIFTGKLQSDVVCQVFQNVSTPFWTIFTWRCARVSQQQLILSGTFHWTCQQLLMDPPFPWTSASTDLLRQNTLAQCPKSGWWSWHPLMASLKVTRDKPSTWHTDL